MTKKYLDSIKTNLNFDGLPGKEKPLLAGFSAKNLGSIFHTVRAVKITKHEDKWIHSRFSLLDDKSAQMVKLDLIVAQKNCADAHEALFLSYALNAMPFSLILGNNKEIQLGDFCLVPDAKLPARRIDFVRNNIAVKLSNTKHGNQDVFKIAHKIDSILQQASGYETLEESQQLPLVSRFEIDNSSLRFSDKAFFKIDVENPEKGKLNYLFDINGGSVNMVAEDKAEYYYRAGHEPGRYEITLNVINQRSLLSRKSLFVNIESQ